jgi:hypothetical protein
MPPHADAVSGLLGGDKAGKDGPLGVCGGYRDNVRQDALKPGHLQFRAFGKHPLHIDAKMNRAVAGRAVP